MSKRQTAKRLTTEDRAITEGECRDMYRIGLTRPDVVLYLTTVRQMPKYQARDLSAQAERAWRVELALTAGRALDGIHPARYQALLAARTKLALPTPEAR